MKRLGLMTGFLLLGTASGWAATPDMVPLLTTLVSQSDDVQTVRLEVQLGLKDVNPQWQLTQTAMRVLLARLGELQTQGPLPGDALLERVANPEPTYKGLLLRFSRVDGQAYAPLTVGRGVVSAPGVGTLAKDAGRRLEYWLLGTARIRRDLLLGSQIMPVVTFEQCRVLGNTIVETEPRQCLLPDGNILLDTPDKLTAAALKAHDFDSCLKHGQALVYSFPRRCIAAGGRVFTEPPRVEEPPADAPLLGTSAFTAPSVSETNMAVSETAGGLAVSATVAVTPSGN